VQGEKFDHLRGNDKATHNHDVSVQFDNKTRFVINSIHNSATCSHEHII